MIRMTMMLVFFGIGSTPADRSANRVDEVHRADEDCLGCKLADFSTLTGPLPFSVTITYGASTTSGTCAGHFPNCLPAGCTVGDLSYKVSAEMSPLDFFALGGDPSDPSGTSAHLDQGDSVTFFFGNLGIHTPAHLLCGASFGLFSWGAHGYPNSYFIKCTTCPGNS